MKQVKSLNLAILTYNRPQILLNNIMHMNKFLPKYNVEIYVYDDSNNDESKQIIEQYIKEHEVTNVFYRKTAINQGYDYNVKRAFQNTPGDYIYVVGEALCLNEDIFQKVYQDIQHNDFDVVIIKNEKLNTETILNNVNELYVNYAWYVTLIGSTIYSRKNLDIALAASEKYFGLLFLQWAILFEKLILSDIKVKIYKGQYITPHKDKVMSFGFENYLEVFCKNWVEMNNLLPESFPNKAAVIMSHDENTRVLTNWYSLTLLRSNDFINYQKYKEYQKYCDLCLYSRTRFFLVIRTPRLVSQLVVTSGDSLRKVLKR